MENNQIIDTYYQIITILKIKNAEENLIISNLKDVNYIGTCTKAEFKGTVKYQIELNKAFINNEEELIDVICHELAHMKYIGHPKTHTLLTKKYIQDIKEFMY